MNILKSFKEQIQQQNGVMRASYNTQSSQLRLRGLQERYAKEFEGRKIMEMV